MTAQVAPPLHKSPRRWPWIVAGLAFLIANLLLVVFFRQRQEVAAVEPALPVREFPTADPLPWRSKLIASMRNESFLDSVNNLDDMEDNVTAMSAVSNDAHAQDYRMTAEILRYLNRPRKVLAEALQADSAERQQAIQAMHQFLLEPLEIWADLDRLATQDVLAGRNSTRKSEALRKLTETIYRNRSSVYLLGELEDFGSLPILVKVYRNPGGSPVSQVFTFAVMRELVRRHPVDPLPPQARELSEKFQRDSAHLPQPKVVELAKWDASLSESDFRNRILKLDIGVESMPKLQMTIYPDELDQWELPSGAPAPELESLMQSLEAFVNAAYPPAS